MSLSLFCDLNLTISVISFFESSCCSSLICRTTCSSAAFSSAFCSNRCSRSGDMTKRSMSMFSIMSADAAMMDLALFQIFSSSRGIYMHIESLLDSSGLTLTTLCENTVLRNCLMYSLSSGIVIGFSMKSAANMDSMPGEKTLLSSLAIVAERKDSLSPSSRHNIEVK